MGDYESSTTVATDPDRLFDYLADVGNLPEYFPRMTSAVPGDGDEVHVTAHVEPSDGPARDVEGTAWLTVDREAGHLAWGSEGPADYRGDLDVSAGASAGEATLRVHLHTTRADGPDIQQGVDEVVRTIAAKVTG